jgi:hypothetical protein
MCQYRLARQHSFSSAEAYSPAEGSVKMSLYSPETE